MSPPSKRYRESNTDVEKPLHCYLYGFPLQLWDRLIEQTNLTLNLLRQSRLNPKMSAEAMMNDPFDFNRTPIAPLGTKVLVHEHGHGPQTLLTAGILDQRVNTTGVTPYISLAQKASTK